MHEQFVAIAAAVGERIGVDAIERLRQREMVRKLAEENR